MPKYPIWLTDNERAWVIKKPSEFDVAEKNYIESGKLYLLSGFDYDMNKIRCSGYKIKGLAGFFGWRIGYQGKYYSIEIDFESNEAYKFGDLKSYLVDFVNLNYEFYEPAWNIDDLVVKIMDCTNKRELFEFL